MMVEKEIKYMGNTIKYKMVQIPNEKDNYGRDKVIKLAKQSDAEHITDEESGVMYWTANAFVDMQINAYIADDEYNSLTDEDAIAIAKKIKL